MNLTTIIQYLLTFATGAIGGYLSYKGTKATNKSNTESVYAQSLPEMISKVQDLLEQLESKNGKIAELTAQVEAQSSTIKGLNERLRTQSKQLASQSKTIDEMNRQLGMMIRSITHASVGELCYPPAHENITTSMPDSGRRREQRHWHPQPYALASAR